VLSHRVSLFAVCTLTLGGVVFAALASGSGRTGEPVPLPFARGERFIYDISWLYLKAGTAVMAVDEAPPEGDRRTLKLWTTADSSRLVTKFYPVANRVESIVDLETFLPARMTFKRREGKRKNDFEYTFHHGEGTVTAVKDGKADELPIPADAQDAVSCLYFVRKALRLAPGESLSLNVHHDKKNYKVTVQVEALEKLEGPWGKIPTARVLAIMPFQGIFLNEGNIRVWLTTDEHRIPVRMKAKVIIGSIVADLVSGLNPMEKS
jgi:hypothetical protein